MNKNKKPIIFAFFFFFELNFSFYSHVYLYKEIPNGINFKSACVKKQIYSQFYIVSIFVCMLLTASVVLVYFNVR